MVMVSMNPWSYIAPNQDKYASSYNFRLLTHLPLDKITDILAFMLTRYVDGTSLSEVTPVNIRYIHPPHHGYL